MALIANQLGSVQLLVDLVLKSSKVSNRDDLKASLSSYAVRVIGSQLAPSVSIDEHAVMQGILQDLELQGKAEASSRVLELYERLGRSGSRMNAKMRWGILYLLRQVAKDNGTDDGLMTGMSASSLQLLTQSLGSAGLHVVQPGGARPGSQASGGIGKQPPYTVHLPPSSSSSRVFQDDVISGRSALGDQDGSLFTVKEPLLVKDVLYACQGVNGKYTAYQSGAGAERFMINPQVDIPPPDRELMSGLMELGFLFKRVQHHVSHGRPDHGAIHQAMCAALGNESKEFYRFMSILQAQSTEPIPSPGDMGDGTTAAPYLTLRRLEVWLAEPIRRMRLLAAIADATSGLTGGALAGAVYAHVHTHGDPFVRTYAAKILHAACVPLFEMIRRWVFEGQVEDPHGEFFVVKLSPPGGGGGGTATSGGGAAEQQAVDMWRNGYAIDGSRLPQFLSQKLASRILRAGKSVNFLQECCGDAVWVQERAMSAQAAAASAVSIGQVEGLERFVQEASSHVDRRLIDILFNKFDLAKHCDAMRRYVLLGQGDFVQALMDMAQEDLGQEASAVSEISLNHAVRQAISASNAKYDDDDIVDRVRARKNKAFGGGELGWDVFRIHYEIRGPLATLFTPAATSQYLRVFQLLWRLKRAECDLNQAWKVLKCEVERTAAKFNSVSRGGADLALEVVRKFLRLRSEMSHFCTNLQYYIMFEVLETSWQEFNQQAASATDLDELIQAHERYLSTLLRKALLGEQTEALRGTLKELLENMLTLRGQVRKLSDLVRGAYSRLNQAKARIDQRTAKGQWGTVLGDDDVKEVPASDLEPLSRGIEELDRRHRKGIAEFTQRLPSQAHEEVRFLLYRLDFTEFYSKKMLPGTEDGADDGMLLD